VAVARSGATIVLRAGTYHESVTVPTNKPLTIQSYPHEAVWLDGSVPVSGWTQQGKTWVHNGWTAQFDSTPSYTGVVQTGPYLSFVNPAYPMAAAPDQAWLNGTKLNQVGSVSDVGPGDFYVNYSSHQLIVGSNPSAGIRASDLSVALTTYSPHSVIRGIGVRNYADSIAQVAAVRLDGAQDAVENLLIEDNATTGLSSQEPGISVRQVTLRGNGMLGMGAHHSDDLTISGMLAQDNNAEHFNYSPNAGGLKVTGSRGITVDRSTFVDNLGTGAWFDESCYDLSFINNQVQDNAGHGVSFEISSTGVIANNVIEENGQIGLKINNTDHVRVWNNTITNNNSEVQVVEDARRGTNPSDPGHDSRQKQPDPTEPWIVSNVSLMNNILGSVPSGSTVVIVRDYSGQYSAAQLKTQLSGNAFVGTGGGPLVVWGTGGNGAATYSSVATFQSGTGQLGNSSATEAKQVDRTSGQPLPSDIASMISQPSGSKHVGAY
jgi:parallel beta-helix repeat protein